MHALVKSETERTPWLEELIGNPDWYIDRVDPVEGVVKFVRTDMRRLVSTTFLDGRTPFATGEAVPVELSELAGAIEPSASPLRLILHMSFCGSTQLAHLVDATGAAIVLKEPHSLVDLADWSRALREQGKKDARFAGALDSAVTLLGRRWDGNTPIVVKPSNWANCLIPALLDDPRDKHVVMVVIGRRSFLRAAFRGGRDRLAFTARIAAHFAGATGQTHLLTEIVAQPDPLDRVARLVLFLHSVQARWFEQMAAGRAASHAFIAYRTILHDPRLALEQAVAALGLSSASLQTDAALRAREGKHSKSPGRVFTAAGEHVDDQLVEHYHQSRFDRALQWADGRFPAFGLAT